MITLRKLAERAKVSVGTVSKSFSNSSEISEKTRQHVFDTAKKLGCFEKYYKGERTTKMVALICPELCSEYYTKTTTILQSKFEKVGISTIIFVNDFSVHKIDEFVKYATSTHCIDGLVFIQQSRRPTYPTDLPIVFYSPHFIKEKGHTNWYYDSIYQALSYLKENGHTKIAYIGEYFCSSKQAAFTDASKQLNLYVEPSYIINAEKRFEEGGYEAMEQIYALEDKPTAILAAYDYMALGAMACIVDHGQKVPDDFSIIGMDNISITSHPCINLTTITTIRESLCDEVVEHFVKKFKGYYLNEKRTASAERRLIVRKSVKKIN